MLAHVLQMPRLKVYLEFSRELSEPELASLREMVRRRSEREPLQHILGSTSFCGLEIMVNRGVLIPRPETEILAEKAWRYARQLAAAGERPLVLDIGTGSACIAIAIASHCPQAEVHATDVSAEALAVARQNIERHGLQERIHVSHPDKRPASQYDVIVSNPPYIATSTIAELQPEVKDHDPHLALDGGPDGLDVIRRLATTTPGWLASGGCLLMEFGDDQEQPVCEIFTAAGWTIESVEKDFSGRARILIAHRNNS